MSLLKTKFHLSNVIMQDRKISNLIGLLMKLFQEMNRKGILNYQHTNAALIGHLHEMF